MPLRFLNGFILMNQSTSDVKASTSIVSNDGETSIGALMINTCESSHYLGQLQTADTKQSITAVRKNDRQRYKRGMKNDTGREEVRADGL